LAFEVLAHEDTHGDASVRAHLVGELAKGGRAPRAWWAARGFDLLAETRTDLSIAPSAPAEAQDRA
jgi:hypothetical protein